MENIIKSMIEKAIYYKENLSLYSDYISDETGFCHCGFELVED